MTKPFDVEVLKQNLFYQPTLDLLWASRMAKEGEADANTKSISEKTAESHLSNAIVGCFGTLVWRTGFEPHDVISHLMDVDFKRWMASPEGIAHNEKINRIEK